jgi:hypothetical protein
LRNHPKLLIHIGYHKTGTTWLQTGIFQDKTAGFTTPWNSKQIREHFVFPTQFEFNPTRARDIFLRSLDDTEGYLIPVISDERLSGSPHSGGYDSALVADRLAEVFPEAFVLIVIREQKSAIYSIYQQYVRDGGAAPLKNYLNPRNPAEIPQFRFSHLEYHYLIQYYFKLFGKTNVLVLPYEWLSKTPDEFLDKITEFSGLNGVEISSSGTRYRSFSAMTIALKRWANLLLVRNSLNPAARLYVKDHERRFQTIDRFSWSRLSKRLEVKERAYIEETVGDRYAYSNRETSKLIKTDLKTFGYTILGD